MFLFRPSEPCFYPRPELGLGRFATHRPRHRVHGWYLLWAGWFWCSGGARRGTIVVSCVANGHGIVKLKN